MTGPGLVEVDVTTARRRCARAADPPTMTAFLLASLGRAVARHPELSARRAGRRLVLFDDVDVAVSVERGLSTGPLPLPHVVRRASERSAADIGAELTEVRSAPASGPGDLVGRPWVARTPAVLRRMGARAAGRVPAAVARFGPPIGLSSLGMFGAGWGIPLSPMTVMVTVGGSSRRLVPVDGRAEEREVLPPAGRLRQPAGGDWTVVVMRADGAAGVAADVRAGVTAPGLGWLITGLFTTAVVLLALGGLLVGLAVPQFEDRRPDAPRPGTRPHAGAEPHAVR